MGLRFSNDILLVTEQIYPTKLEEARGKLAKPLKNELASRKYLYNLF